MSEQLFAITTNGAWTILYRRPPWKSWKLELALELINYSYGFIPLFGSFGSITAQVDAYNNACISYSIEVRRGVQSRKLCSTVCYVCFQGRHLDPAESIDLLELKHDLRVFFSRLYKAIIAN
ncbi:hypothetical protein MKW98_012920 [Papaver atlanticum]|uniref:Uncharacterized protein n=1 Tax=Papaver atlanticum TaxID=357466 RepID=A0AAD4SIP6_9MAGN|nr:hypothetical protein MKW98_012920 [Papaver atlanticum]